MGLGYNYYKLSTLPRIHTVVWCRLPADDGRIPGPEFRPALVRAANLDRTTDRGGVWVSYGTKHLRSTERGHIDLIIQNSSRLQQLGLPSATRFDLDLTNWLPWASEFFAAPSASRRVVAGVLTESEKTRLRQRLKRRGIILAL